MQQLSIARSLRLALLGLTVALAVIASLGLSSLYTARQRYESRLARTSSLAVAAANLSSAAITEQQVLRDARGATGAPARENARRAYLVDAGAALSLAREDPVSASMIRQQIAAGPGSLAQTLAGQLQQRQRELQGAARSRARSESRRAVLLVAVAGVLAIAGAMALITLLVRSMRRPLDELVDATRGLAGGQLSRRVDPSGPRELQELGDSFNAMAEDLAVAQRRIEEERRRLAVTIESLGDALLVTEPGSSIVATANPRAAELVPELAVGSDMDGEDSPLPPLEAAARGEKLVEHRGRALAVTAAPLGSSEDGVVWTLRDMSERARLEQAKSDFVATASHELRSPLTSIKGFVELLKRSPEQMSERQREFVEIILRSTDRLVDLVNDLLDVARIEADHVEINRRPIDVGEAVREVAELMGPRIAEKGQHLDVRVAPKLPLALADPGRIRQIVANLLTNAHLYTDRGGSLAIDVGCDRACIHIVVQDSGRGMSHDEAERVFDRFYRGRNGSSTTPGSGLGLSIVKSLVDLHHGRIEVDSEPGRGTRFRVELPVAVPAEEAARTLEHIRGSRVLIVDDERDIAELIAGQLGSLELQTRIAVSGHEALDLLRSEQFDAVTLDILMPEMDGFAVLREIRSDPKLRAIPIVFVSVFTGHELAGEWVVAKPIDSDELRDVLAAALTEGRSRVLVVGRSEMQWTLAPALQELGIEHQWETTGAAAARVCGERRFEVALIDVGIRNPRAALQALDLRGRRLRRAVILFSDGATPTPPGVDKLGMEIVPVDHVAEALLAALGSGPEG